jgi:O-antigen ligase
MADMFFMIIVFAALLSFLETFFLARNDSLWLMHVFAVFGLHLLARFRQSVRTRCRADPVAGEDRNQAGLADISAAARHSAPSGRPRD